MSRIKVKSNGIPHETKVLVVSPDGQEVELDVSSIRYEIDADKPARLVLEIPVSAHGDGIELDIAVTDGVAKQLLSLPTFKR